MKHGRFFMILFLCAMLVLPGAVPQATADASEPIVLNVYRGERMGQPAQNNKIYELIEEQFGIRFNFQFLSDGNELDEEVGLILSGGDLPDLFDGSNDADAVIQSGKLVNLLDYISPEGTPNLWEHIQSQRSRIVQKDDEGNDVLYIIPNYGIYDGEQTVTSVGGPAFFVQKQVLEYAGYPDVKDLTMEQYFELIENFIEDNPTDGNGNAYTGFAILNDDWRNWGLINPVQHLMGRPNDGSVLVDVNSDDLHTETFIDKPYAKAYYKELNDLYQKGIITAESFNMSYDEYMDQISQGTVLGMFDQAWNFGAATNTLINERKYENTYVALGPVYSQDTEGIPEGWTITEHYVNGSLPNTNRGYGISVDCECPERIVAMWEAMMTEEWQMILNWGIEGEDYYIEDGRLKMTEEQYANTMRAEWRLNNKADALFQSSPKRQGTIQTGELAGNSWTPDTQDEIVLGLMNDYDQEFLEHFGYSKFSDFLNAPIELAPYGEAWQIDYGPVDVEYYEFLGIQLERLPELITCDAAEFDQKWDAFVEEIAPTAAVFQEYMQEQIGSYAGGAEGICGPNTTWKLNRSGTLTISGTGEMDVLAEESTSWYPYREEILEVVIEDGVTNAGESAFYDLKNLKRVTMADSVTSIDDCAFMWCVSLSEVELSNQLTTIGTSAFYDCPALTTVTLPASLTSIGDSAFCSCGLTEIKAADGTGTKTWDLFYPWDYTEYYLYHVQLPEAVTEVGFAAFCDNPLAHDAPEFILPPEVTAVEAETFAGINARFVWLSAGVETIGQDAFAGCPSLKFIYIPYGCESIAPHAFPEGTAILTDSGYYGPCYAAVYAEENNYKLIEFENPFGGNG